VIEASDRTLLGYKECPCYAVLFEQRGQGALVASFGSDIAREKVLSIQLDPAIDKGRYSAKDEVTAKTFAVEDGTSQPHAFGNGERCGRRDAIVTSSDGLE